tara:strand:- start:1885 stop:2877 length:993 start_codon:yes stop_codon:yes gene_type:complete
VPNLNNILHGIGIPLSALISIIFGMMILSFPLGTYAVFNSSIGDDIDYNFPQDQFDIFIAGLHLGIPIEFEIGDIFIVFWSIFLIFFVITFLGPKNNFLKSIMGILNKEKDDPDGNYLVNIIKWFSIIVVISAIINFIQESFGIVTSPPASMNDLTMFLAITISPITEELGFRVMLIGIPLFLIFTHKSSFKFFFSALWHPYKNLHIVQHKRAIGIIVAVGLFFGLAHIISGEPWSEGKFAQAAISGIIIGWVYYRYGLISAILVHWATNYFIYSYLFFISDLNQISIQNAVSHSMIGTLEVILVVTGVISIAMIVINHFNAKNQKKLSM